MAHTAIASMRDPRRVLVVCIGAVWVAQAFTLGELLGEALGQRSPDVRSTASAMAWIWWFATLLALAAPRPVGLTAGRIGAVAALPAGLWAALHSDDAALVVIGLAAALTATGVVLLPGVGDRYVDGESYGDERRFLLRPPGPVMLAVLPVAWAVTVAALWAPPLLLASHRWVLGAIAVVVGAALAFGGFRAMHQLSRRFVVFVPNGLVLHDPATLREPVLFTRQTIARLRPADADSTALDLSASALGLALELSLTEPVTLALATGRDPGTGRGPGTDRGPVTGRGGTGGGRSSAGEQQVGSLLFSPTRPAAVLATAAERAIPIA